jgi:hypothetical protein
MNKNAAQGSKRLFAVFTLLTKDRAIYYGKTEPCRQTNTTVRIKMEL